MPFPRSILPQCPKQVSLFKKQSKNNSGVDSICCERFPSEQRTMIILNLAAKQYCHAIQHHVSVNSTIF